MTPIQLTIEGLYSYQERQKIDFEKLTEAGLFGIFGSVGSGKSSILEAISFALYGETERLNSRDKRAYNMMNLKSNKSYIEFDFLNFENKKFRAVREFRRNSKNFEDVKTPTVSFYEWIREKWIPLDHSNTEKIIGLSYANFKRTIIIPQGQFKEFLELGATDRTNMMKEIFSLQRFDLQNNVSALHTKNRSELDHLEGQLRGFEEVNEEQILVQKENLKLEKQKFEEVKKRFKETEEKYQQLKNLKTDFESLKQKKNDFEKLSGQKAEVDQSEIKTELYDQVSRIFIPLTVEKDKLQKEISEQNIKKENQARILQETEDRSENIKNNLAAVLPKFEALEQSKIQENDLVFMIKMLQFSEDIKTLKVRTEKGSEKVKEVEAGQNLIQQKSNELLKKIDSLKPQKIESDILISAGNWFLEQKNLKESEKDQRVKIEDFHSKIEHLNALLTSSGINPENFREDFKIRSEALENESKVLSEKRNQLEVQQKLAHFAGELHDGESCPLCGSPEHPNIVEFDDVHAELTDLDAKIQINRNQFNETQKQFAETEKIIDRKKIFEEQQKTETGRLGDLTTRIETHRKNFIWSGFSIEDEAGFEKKRQQSFETEKQIEELNRQMTLQQKAFEQEREHLEKYKKALEEFKLDEAKKEEQIKTNEANLKTLQWVDYQNKDISEVQDLYKKLSQSNLETEQNYQQLIREEKEISPKLAEQKTLLTQLESRIEELTKEISDNENRITNSLVENNFSSFGDIQAILLQKINVQEIRNRIQTFRIQFATLKNGITELENKLKDFSFDEEKYSFTENQFNVLENELKTANDAVVKTGSEVERLEKEFKKKENLLKELAQLQKRAENLKVMTGLFKGAGFVQYVSSIYLRQLCDHANVRFHRMTRNQLSLQLNENNDFEIIDYLNEGRSRSVKTLSGGQSFQVSLSLALALAESVQANAVAERNFFFIDEGFGTQDIESVNIVFETLMNLQKENRIVGIISHVEELKEKIPVALNITKDEEKGSLIEIV